MPDERPESRTESRDPVQRQLDSIDRGGSPSTYREESRLFQRDIKPDTSRDASRDARRDSRRGARE